MKRTETLILRAIAFSVIVLCANAAESNSPADSQLLKTVLQLRAEFLEFMLEAHQSTVRALKRELDQLHEQEHRVQQAEDERAQQTAHVERQLSSPDLESEVRLEVEAV